MIGTARDVTIDGGKDLHALEEGRNVIETGATWEIILPRETGRYVMAQNQVKAGEGWLLNQLGRILVCCGALLLHFFCH